MNIGKISSWVLGGLSVITIGVLVAFYFGGDGENSTAEMWEPKNTEWLVDWAYIVLFIGLLSVIGFSVRKFLLDLKDDPKEALKSLFGIVVVLALLGVCWFIGDGTPLNIVGYEGRENTYFWLKWTDMLLFASYVLVVVAVMGILISRIVRMIRR